MSSSSRDSAPPGTLSAREIAAQVRFGDIQWEPGGNRLLWLEQRSDRGVLVAWDPACGNRRDVTAEISVRASWGYGGGDFAAGPGCLYFLSGTGFYQQLLDKPGPSLLATDLSSPTAPVPSPDSGQLLLVSSPGSRDHLDLIPTDGSGARTVNRYCNFVMQPAWHPAGDKFVWLGWDHPNMPWDGTGLFVASLPETRTQLVAGAPNGSVAVFQPSYSPDGRWLSFVTDENGWFNLKVLSSTDLRLKIHLEEEAEHAPPAWIQGLRSYCWSPDSTSLLLVRSIGGFDQLVRVDLESAQTSVVTLPGWTAISQPAISAAGQVAFVGSSAERPPAIVLLRGAEEPPVVLRRSLPALPRTARHHPPEPVRWHSSEGEECFGLWYAPTSGAQPPAAVVRVHGGPTSQYRAGFEPDVQLLAARGIGVLDLNYRGSAGYGRAYRCCLNGRWGEADVEDLLSAARFLADSGRADRRRLVAMGGSAGGFTVLLALARQPGLFAAAVCRYAVSDLLGLAAETHKFEQHYLDRLVGELPAHEALYRHRSPLRVADAIRDPVALFQGTDDRVVPPSQTERLVEKLAQNGVPHVYRLYPGEGHGWRKTETIADYYRTVDKFLDDVLAENSDTSSLLKDTP